jgi:dTDP-4-dehydrorhamnose reductase
MRTLILGGGGMLGRAVVRAGRRRGLPALALTCAQADLTDRERLLYWADAYRPELIVNCAAYTKVDACETERERAMEVNGRAVGNAVAAAERAGARLIQVSTDYVFDGAATSPYDEEAPTAPISVYGESKLEGERQALAYERALVVRSSWLFGHGGPNFVATILDLIERGERTLDVVDDQTGCPTYTPYLAEAIWLLARTGATGVVHYRNREPVTWHGFATEIAKLWDSGVEVRPVTTDQFPRPARRPAYSVLAIDRFERATGRRVEPWGLGLVEYLADLRRTRSRC